MNPFEYGDPYIEWNEEISAREDTEDREDREFKMEALKAEVTNLLVTNYDFSMDEAEDMVNSSAESENPDMWNENSEAAKLAEFLASDGDAE